MTAGGLNADFSRSVLVRSAAEDWQSSPSPTVWRKRLDLSGPAEAGRVTSVVRYDPGSEFHSHPHPDGEEILVLSGVFSDEHGDYPEGTYLLNPEGFAHSPFSKAGCVLFVKLRQYAGLGRCQVSINTGARTWVEARPGVLEVPLYEDNHYPETVRLVRVETGIAFTVPAGVGGAEMFILDGVSEDTGGRYSSGDWLRWPAQTGRTFTANTTFKAYLKTGHLQI